MQFLARLISVVFHPLLFPTYGALYILWANPNMYGYFGEKLHIVWLIIVFALTFVFPGIWLAMMKQLEMIESFELPTAKERIIPFIATITFYLWAGWMFKPAANMKIPPNEFIFLMLVGASIAAFIAFFVNIFTKISLHALGVGGLVGLTLILIRFSTYDLRLALVGAIVVAGLTGTARLVLKAHTPTQVFMGYLAGFFGQFVAFTVVARLI